MEDNLSQAINLLQQEVGKITGGLGEFENIYDPINFLISYGGLEQGKAQDIIGVFGKVKTRQDKIMEALQILSSL